MMSSYSLQQSRRKWKPYTWQPILNS